MKRWLKLLLFGAIPVVLLLLLGEGVCRLLGHPRGRFASVYPPNATLTMTWGAVPYTVKTNSLGLRGHELQAKEPGRKRILALGDSITDGFFSDNEDTYPWKLEELLRLRGLDVEVVNAGMGACSIDAEAATLSGLIGLKPDLVVLTFVTNDIHEIEGKRREDLASFRASAPAGRGERKLDGSARLTQWLVVHSGLGEVVLDSVLRLRFASYRVADKADLSAPLTPQRYHIEGGSDYAANASLFMDAFGGSDGIVLQRPLSPHTRELVDNYLFALDRVADFCRRHDATLVLVYFPCYPQVYDPSSSMEMRDILAHASTTLAIPFVDLTPALREAGRGQVLHLAPVDFHPNPSGNEAIARTIADSLASQRLLG